MTLLELARKLPATVAAIHADEAITHRLRLCGVWPGRPIEILRVAPMGGPLHVRIGAAEFLLRRDMAAQVEVA